MTTGQLTVHTENLLPIIKKWLYSEKDIFIRELISNACDAIQKLKVLSDNGQAEINDAEFRIEILANQEERTLTFRDNGIGMDADEVRRYICQLAFSGAEEFLTKYQTNREGDQIIGHFGLGFFSAYMVASKVEIQTLSYRPGATPVHWWSDGSSEYQIEAGERTSRGTSIILHLDKEGEEFLNIEHLRTILRHYCAFLPYPIYLGEERINPTPPLWLKAPTACTREDYLEFYRLLYPGTEDPLFWVHLNVDYPFHLKGILYFPKLQRHLDLRQYSVKLFCNRVFVSDSCKDVIPDYLMVLRGALDSPDIPLNVSRSHLQMDRTVKQLGAHISKKVSDSLSALYQSDKPAFIEAWKDISVVVKLGAVEDDKFYERVKDLILWKTVQGSWVTVQEYLQNNGEKTKNKIFYISSEKHAKHLVEAYTQKGIDVLITDSAIDLYVINVLEKHLESGHFQRIGSTVDDSLIDPSREKKLLDAEGKTEAGRLADFVRNQLGDPSLEVEAKSLAFDTLPAVVTFDEQARRLREYMQAMNPEDTTLHQKMPESRKLILNTNSPLLASILKMENTQPELARDLVQEVYELTLLGQHELSDELRAPFVARSQKVLEALATKLVERG